MARKRRPAGRRRLVQQHPVHFIVHHNGDIDYIPGLLHATPGDQVTWTCNVDGNPADPFFVEFIGTSPFDAIRYGNDRPGVIDYKTIRPNAANGEYHYRVRGFRVIRRRGRTIREIFGTFDCPEINIP